MKRWFKIALGIMCTKLLDGDIEVVDLKYAIVILIDILWEHTLLESSQKYFRALKIRLFSKSLV